MTDEGLLHQGHLTAAISNAVVGELARTTGRGPTQAKTTLGANAVFVVVQDTLTRGERTLVSAGEENAVLNLRRLWQSAMRESCSQKIEALTERKVIGFMSDNHIDPDVAVEVFILEPLNEVPAGEGCPAPRRALETPDFAATVVPSRQAVQPTERSF